MARPAHANHLYSLTSDHHHHALPAIQPTVKALKAFATSETETLTDFLNTFYRLINFHANLPPVARLTRSS